MINVGFDLWLIPRYGIWGAVLPVGCVVVTAPLVYAAVLHGVRQEVRVPWDFLRRVLLASTGWCVLVPVLPMITSIPRLAVAFVVGACAVLVGVRLTRAIGPEEVRLLHAVHVTLTPRMRWMLGLPPGEGATSDGGGTGA